MPPIIVTSIPIMEGELEHGYELVCPAGTATALENATLAGVDAVYVGLRNETNARNFPGINFSHAELENGVKFAHSHGTKVYLIVNTHAEAGNTASWYDAIDVAAKVGVDAIVLADIGLLSYAHENYPDLPLHLSVNAGGSNASSINFYASEFDIKRVILPKALNIDEISKINAQISIESEVMAFGGMCPFAEGSCSLSSYATGVSLNQSGECSPASHVTYEQLGTGLSTKLAGLTINNFLEHEIVKKPTICKGRFMANGKTGYLFDTPSDKNYVKMLPEYMKAGVSAFKIEGRQKNKEYIFKVVEIFRRAVEQAACDKKVDSNLDIAIQKLSENENINVQDFKKDWM